MVTHRIIDCLKEAYSHPLEDETFKVDDMIVPSRDNYSFINIISDGYMDGNQQVIDDNMQSIKNLLVYGGFCRRQTFPDRYTGNKSATYHECLVIHLGARYNDLENKILIFFQNGHYYVDYIGRDNYEQRFSSYYDFIASDMALEYEMFF